MKTENKQLINTKITQEMIDQALANLAIGNMYLDPKDYNEVLKLLDGSETTKSLIEKEKSVCDTC